VFFFFLDFFIPDKLRIKCDEGRRRNENLFIVIRTLVIIVSRKSGLCERNTRSVFIPSSSIEMDLNLLSSQKLQFYAEMMSYLGFFT